MATSVSYVGDGSTRAYNIDFAFDQSETIYATVDEVPASFTWSGASQITLDTAPTAGAVVRIYRRTDVDAPEVVFQNAQVLHAENLNDAVDQVLDSDQEQWEEIEVLAASTLRTPRGDAPMGFLPKLAQRAGNYLAFDAEGQPYAASGSGADGALRTDLAQPTGGSLVAYMATGAGASRSIQSKLRDRASAKDYGAVADNANPDQDAVAAAALNNNVIDILGGTHRLQPNTLMPFYLRNLTKNFYAAVVLTASDRTFSGPGTVRSAIRTAPNAGEISYAFSTLQNMTPGDITDLTWSGITFDLNNDAEGLVTSNQRHVHVVGGQRISFLGIKSVSKGAKRGKGIGEIDNSSDVLLAGFQQHYTTGFLNFRYTDNAVMWGGTLRNSSESFDFDGGCKRVIVGGVAAYGADRVSSQIIDANNVTDGVFGPFVAENYANIAVINQKTSSVPPTYAQYVALQQWQANHAYAVGDRVPGGLSFVYEVTVAGVSGATAPAAFAANSTSSAIADGTVTWKYVDIPWTFTKPARIAVGPVSGTKIGGASSPIISIGDQWTSDGSLHHRGTGPAEDVIVRDIQVTDCGGINILEGKRIGLFGINLSNVTSYAGTVGAISASCSNFPNGLGNGSGFEYSELDLTASDVIIDGTKDRTVDISNGGKVTLRGLKLRNTNTTGTASMFALNLNNMFYRESWITVDECEISGGLRFNSTSANILNWAASTVYEKNQLKKNGGNIYRCTQTGTSASSGGPTGVDPAVEVTDGTCKWIYVPNHFDLRWGKLNRLAYGEKPVFVGDTYLWPNAETATVNLPDMAATGQVRRLLLSTERRTRVMRMRLVPLDTIAAGGVNFRTFKVYRRVKATGAIVQIGTAAGITSAAGFTEFVELAFQSADLGDNAMMERGDQLYLEAASSGTGQALTGLSVVVEHMPL